MADLRAEVNYLGGQREWDWIVLLHDDLAEAEAMVLRFPNSGFELAHQGTESLRRLRMRRAPFFVWYSADAASPDRVVRFLRLFHTRQRAPKPRL